MKDEEKEKEKPKRGFASPEAKRQFLANPNRFPTDEEWEDMTELERHTFTMSFEDD